MSAARKLTARQREVLDMVADLTAANGFPPTLRELGIALGCSYRVAREHLCALARKGALARGFGKMRAVRVLALPIQPPSGRSSVESILGT